MSAPPIHTRNRRIERPTDPVSTKRTRSDRSPESVPEDNEAADHLILCSISGVITLPLNSSDVKEGTAVPEAYNNGLRLPKSDGKGKIVLAFPLDPLRIGEGYPPYRPRALQIAWLLSSIPLPGTTRGHIALSAAGEEDTVGITRVRQEGEVAHREGSRRRGKLRAPSIEKSCSRRPRRCPQRGRRVPRRNIRETSSK